MELQQQLARLVLSLVHGVGSSQFSYRDVFAHTLFSIPCHNY